jgi:hypothetical protein
MSAEDIFRGAVISRPLTDDATASDPSVNDLANETVCVADEISAALRPGSRARKVEAEYETPADEKRFLAVTVSPVSAEDGSPLGVACVIDDRTELEVIRSGQVLRPESAAGVSASVS